MESKGRTRIVRKSPPDKKRIHNSRQLLRAPANGHFTVRQMNAEVNQAWQDNAAGRPAFQDCYAGLATSAGKSGRAGRSLRDRTLEQPRGHLRAAVLCGAVARNLGRGAWFVLRRHRG